MWIEMIADRSGVSLMLLVTSLCGVPCAAAGQLHNTTGESDTELAASGATEAVPAWAGPTARTVALFSQARTASDQTPLSHYSMAVMPQVRNQRGVPYMVAGGILFVAGAIAEGDGGTLLMVGGAGVSAYGAFIYFGG